MANKIDNDLEIVAARTPARPGEIRASEVIKRLGVSHQALYRPGMLELLRPRVALTRTMYFDEAHVNRIASERAAVSKALTATAVGKQLGVSASMVRVLDPYLVPTVITVGKRTVRTYDAGRVQRCKEIRDQSAARGDRKVPSSAYDALLTEATSAPSSQGMPAVRDPKVRGQKPTQVTKPRNGKAAAVAAETERVKNRVVNRISKNRKNNP